MFRNPFRTLIVMILTALPFFSVLMMVSLQNGIETQITKMKKSYASTIRIKPKGSFGTANIAGIRLEEFDDETYFTKEVLKPGPGLVKSGLKSIGGRPFKVIGIFESGYHFNNLPLQYEVTTAVVLLLISLSAVVGMAGSSYVVMKSRKISPLEAIRHT